MPSPETVPSDDGGAAESVRPPARSKRRRSFLGRLRGPRQPASRPTSTLPSEDPLSEPTAIWSEVGSLSSSQADSRSPCAALASDGTLHVLWEEGNDIQHCYRRRGNWSPPTRVATGERPSLVVDEEGTPHALFANEFGGNWEIYYVSWRFEVWSLPRNVSHTSGVSATPRIVLASDGTLHGVWSDTTPGYSVIYYARQIGSYWVNNQIPSARGDAPAIAIDGKSRVHVVWQGQDPPLAPFEVYYSRWDGSDWTLPENISAKATAHSAICNLGTDSEGTAYLVWEQKEENGNWQVYYCYGRVGYWSVPENISQAPEPCHLARIVVSAQDYLYVGWSEGTALWSCRKGAKADAWFPAETVASNSLGLEDLDLAVGPEGRVHAVWSGHVNGGLRSIFHGERPPAMQRRIFNPLTMGKQRRWKKRRRSKTGRR